MKTCADCKIEKPLHEFSLTGRSERKNHYSIIEYKTICKPCNVKRIADYRRRNPGSRINEWLRVKYNLTRAQYEELKVQSGNQCPVCWHEYEKPHIDHDHRTGKVRGLLCMECNLLLGLALEDSEILRRAADYLDRHKSKEIGNH